ncbi:MAG: hypothetical protein NWE89_14170 [Candidatus Bathyarchaeota archaeon]|nr:hypothetical protein [Candidatus Bathyarchaeota archaeon]
MSKIIKCKICGITDDEKCGFMKVVIDEDGKETAYCCDHVLEKTE